LTVAPRRSEASFISGHVLTECKAVGTPGFGPSDEGYFRLSAFGQRENVIEAVERIKKNLK